MELSFETDAMDGSGGELALDEVSHTARSQGSDDRIIVVVGIVDDSGPISESVIVSRGSSRPMGSSTISIMRHGPMSTA